MIATLIVVALIMGALVFWLIRQTINVQPWAEEGPIGHDHAGGALSPSSAKIGLIVFLAVATSLFSLFMSAYFQRMEFGDWKPLPEPGILWLNTGLLILGSVFFQRARNAVIRNQENAVKTNLLMAGLFTFCIYRRPTMGVARIAKCRLFSYLQPSQCVLLRAHRGTRVTYIWWLVGLE